MHNEIEVSKEKLVSWDHQANRRWGKIFEVLFVYVLIICPSLTTMGGFPLEIYQRPHHTYHCADFLHTCFIAILVHVIIVSLALHKNCTTTR